MESITRRKLIRKAALATGSFALPSGRGAWAANQQDGPSLKLAGERHGISVGCAVQSEPLRSDLEYLQIVLSQFDSIVAESEMKFGRLSPKQGVYDFSRADYLVDFARDHKLGMRGHNLLWHRQQPDWLKSYATPANVAGIIKTHIETVVGRYRGRIKSWDVVNEALDLKDGQPGGFRKSIWYDLMGRDYLDLAYRTARTADPSARLAYNDFGIENEDSASQSKRQAVLELLRGVRKRGVPIDALGIQSHLYAKPYSRFGDGLRDLIAQAASLGFEVYITELDVNDDHVASDNPRDRDAAVASVYEDYLDWVLSQPAVTEVLTWGFADRFTWLNVYEKDKKLHTNRSERSLLYDDHYRPKPAYFAMQRALQQAPDRPKKRSKLTGSEEWNKYETRRDAG